jgi:Flp pilus assembly pilin Flp
MRHRIRQRADPVASVTALLRRHRGASIIEYIGITAVALLLAVAIIGYLQSDGLSSIAQAVAGLIDGIIEAFEATDTVRFR